VVTTRPHEAEEGSDFVGFHTAETIAPMNPTYYKTLALL